MCSIHGEVVSNDDRWLIENLTDIYMITSPYRSDADKLDKASKSIQSDKYPDGASAEYPVKRSNDLVSSFDSLVLITQLAVQMTQPPFRRSGDPST